MTHGAAAAGGPESVAEGASELSPLDRAMQRYAAALELSAIAVSLGDVHSLVYPMPKRDNLIRLSVGCEDEADLVADHTSALDRCLDLDRDLSAKSVSDSDVVTRQQ